MLSPSITVQVKNTSPRPPAPTSGRVRREKMGRDNEQHKLAGTAWQDMMLARKKRIWIQENTVRAASADKWTAPCPLPDALSLQLQVCEMFSEIPPPLSVSLCLSLCLYCMHVYKFVRVRVVAYMCADTGGGQASTLNPPASTHMPAPHPTSSFVSGLLFYGTQLFMLMRGMRIKAGTLLTVRDI